MEYIQLNLAEKYSHSITKRLQKRWVTMNCGDNNKKGFYLYLYSHISMTRLKKEFWFDFPNSCEKRTDAGWMRGREWLSSTVMNCREQLRIENSWYRLKDISLIVHACALCNSLTISRFGEHGTLHWSSPIYLVNLILDFFHIEIPLGWKVLRLIQVAFMRKSTHTPARENNRFWVV